MADSTSSLDHDAGHGRHADRPGAIPKQGWGDILVRVKNEISADNLSMIAAGVAFYGLLAIFPALAALISIYGLIADPTQVQQQISGLDQMLPAEARNILNEQLQAIASQPQTALSVGVGISILFALWSAAKGVTSLMTALNIVYDEQETRSFFKFNGLALLLTLGAILTSVIAIALIVALPALLGNLGLGDLTRTLLDWLRWPLLIVFFMAALAVLYRYGPDRRKPQWRWVSWGAGLATLLWIIGSALFSYYVANFGSYNETYGSVGAVVILLMWFYLSAFIILIGAELNAEMEHQTAQDSTAGPDRPLGQRGARMADTLGEFRR